jgi:uncharacterized protein YjiK
VRRRQETLTPWWNKPGWNLLGLVISFLVFSGAVGFSDESGALISSFDFQAQPARQWQLPRVLNEISGLAVNSRGELFSHNDEESIVFQIDWENGKFVKIFSIGTPTIKDDFEGLAIIDEQFYLITSKGLIYESPEGNNGDHTPFNKYDTGLEKECEVEGLASDALAGKLYILCKRGLKKDLKNKLVIFSWDTTTNVKPTTPLLNLNLTNFDFPKYIQEIEPTSVEVLPGGSGFLVASSKGQVLLEIDALGKLRAWRRLKQKRHPQIEGITILPQGNLIIADEGRPGILTVYEPRPKVNEQ